MFRTWRALRYVSFIIFLFVYVCFFDFCSFTPKLTSDVGGFEFAVNIQQSLSQPSFDSSSDSSRSPTNRMQLRKLDAVHVEPEVSPSEVDHISESRWGLITIDNSKDDMP